MKTKKFHYLLVLALFGLTAFVLPSGSEYYPMEKGIVSIYTHYDDKGKVTKLVTNEITEYSNVDGVEKSVTKSVTDDKEKNGKQTVVQFESMFDGKNLVVDLKKITEETLKAGLTDPSVQVKVEGNNFKLPNNLQIGQQLEEIDLDMFITSGTTNFKFYIHYTDRTVSGKETVTTPAGTFDCFVITSQSEIKMLTKKSGTSKSWIAPGYGLIKQEEYSKKGKLVSSELLTEFKK